MPHSHRHRAEVIEVYEGGLRAAVKFYSPESKGERIECVVRRGMQPPFKVGQTGIVNFTRALNGYEWTFTPRGY